MPRNNPLRLSRLLQMPVVTSAPVSEWRSLTGTPHRRPRRTEASLPVLRKGNSLTGCLNNTIHGKRRANRFLSFATEPDSHSPYTTQFATDTVSKSLAFRGILTKVCQRENDS